MEAQEALSQTLEVNSKAFLIRMAMLAISRENRILPIADILPRDLLITTGNLICIFTNAYIRGTIDATSSIFNGVGEHFLSSSQTKENGVWRICLQISLDIRAYLLSVSHEEGLKNFSLKETLLNNLNKLECSLKSYDSVGEILVKLNELNHLKSKVLVPSDERDKLEVTIVSIKTNCNSLLDAVIIPIAKCLNVFFNQFNDNTFASFLKKIIAPFCNKEELGNISKQSTENLIKKINNKDKAIVAIEQKIILILNLIQENYNIVARVGKNVKDISENLSQYPYNFDTLASLRELEIEIISRMEARLQGAIYLKCKQLFLYKKMLFGNSKNIKRLLRLVLDVKNSINSPDEFDMLQTRDVSFFTIRALLSIEYEIVSLKSMQDLIDNIERIAKKKRLFFNFYSGVLKVELSDGREVDWPDFISKHTSLILEYNKQAGTIKKDIRFKLFLSAFFYVSQRAWHVLYRHTNLARDYIKLLRSLLVKIYIIRASLMIGLKNVMSAEFELGKASRELDTLNKQSPTTKDKNQNNRTRMIIGLERIRINLYFNNLKKSEYLIRVYLGKSNNTIMDSELLEKFSEIVNFFIDRLNERKEDSREIKFYDEIIDYLTNESEKIGKNNKLSSEISLFTTEIEKFASDKKKEYCRTFESDIQWTSFHLKIVKKDLLNGKILLCFDDKSTAKNCISKYSKDLLDKLKFDKDLLSNFDLKLVFREAGIGMNKFLNMIKNLNVMEKQEDDTEISELINVMEQVKDIIINQRCSRDCIDLETIRIALQKASFLGDENYYKKYLRESRLFNTSISDDGQLAIDTFNFKKPR